MDNRICENISVNISVPSQVYSKLCNLANLNEISLNAVILHFVTMGLVTVDGLK
jgi:hypothetical protein